MTIQETIKIPDKILEQWNDTYLPPFDLIYLDDDEVQLPEDLLVMPIEELKANPVLYTLDVSTTFAPWNIKDRVKHVAVIENGQFDRLDKDLQQRLLEMQHELGRDNLFEWNDLNRFMEEMSRQERELCYEHLNKMSFYVEDVLWVAFRQNHWRNLPWEFRKQLLRDMAMAYSSDAIQLRVKSIAVSLTPFIESYVDQFPEKSGPNCFATALAAITENKLSAEWTIHQWVHSQTFLMSLKRRGYKKVAAVTDWKKINLKANDVIVWVNEQFTPVHATAAISKDKVFNKDGQTMFNPWLIRNFHELAGTWDETIRHGGQIYHYRKNDSE